MKPKTYRFIKHCEYDKCGIEYGTNREKQKYDSRQCSIRAANQRRQKAKSERYIKAVAEFEECLLTLHVNGWPLLKWMHGRLIHEWRNYGHVIHYDTIWTRLRETIYPAILKNSWRKPCREAHEKAYPEDAEKINHKGYRPKVGK